MTSSARPRAPRRPRATSTLDDRALHRRAHGDGAGGAATPASAARPRGDAGGAPCRAAALAVGEHGERVVRRRRARRRAAPRAAPRRVAAARRARRRAQRARRRASSTKRVWTRSATSVGMARAARCRNARLVGTPSMRNSPSARCALATASAKRAGARGRSPWRAASRSAGWRVAGVAARVDAHAGARRRLERGERAAGGPRRAVGAPCVSMLTRTCTAKPRGAGTAACASPRLGERRPGGELELQPHEVEPGDLLGDGVLDLQARVRLDEREALAVAAVRVDQELERAEAVERTARASRAPRPRAGARAAPASSPGAGAISTSFWCRRCSAALALAEVRDRAGAVADDLHLDVARARQEAARRRASPLPNAASASERQRAYASSSSSSRADDAHAAPAAAGDRLDHRPRRPGRARQERPRLVERRRPRRCRAAPARRSARRARGRAPCRRRARASRARGPTNARPGVGAAPREVAAFSLRKP